MIAMLLTMQMITTYQKDHTATVPQTKKYQLVYSKCVIDPTTFLTYPYGYLCLTDYDVDMIDMLMDL